MQTCFGLNLPTILVPVIWLLLPSEAVGSGLAAPEEESLRTRIKPHFLVLFLSDPRLYPYS